MQRKTFTRTLLALAAGAHCFLWPRRRKPSSSRSATAPRRATRATRRP